MVFKKGHPSGNRRKEIKWEEDKNSCWICTSHVPNSEGYCDIRRNGKNLKAHRYIYELYNGSIPEGLHVLHKCDVRNCINPEHLFLGTNADNVADKMAKGRCKTGCEERHWKAKLTRNDVIKIKTQLLHLSNQEIANMFGVKKHAISMIRCGRNWKRVGVC